MANLSEITSVLLGGNLRSQIFNSSGTFTPSAALLAKGGRVIVRGIGGGASGAAGAYSSGGVSDVVRRSPMGGGAGKYKEVVVQVTGNVTVTIGTGGAAVSVTSTAGSGTLQTANGNAGGTSTFGGLVSFSGGVAPGVDGGKQSGGGGDGCYGRGRFSTDGTSVTDARGGEGINGIGGGGSGVSWYSTTRSAIDGGGGSGISISGGTITGASATANSGAGGGATWCESSLNVACTATSGAGAAGFIEVIWSE